MAGKPKIYTLDDKQQVTAQYVADKTGVHLKNARVRLHISLDPEQVFKPKQTQKKPNKESYKLRCILERETSIYNEMYRLVFKTI
jgi:hypothetical protein